MCKAMKVVSAIKKLNKTLPRYSLITINKVFIWPDLDCGDTLYDHPNT